MENIKVEKLTLWKSYLINSVIVLSFVAIALAYFQPAVFEGKDLYQQDVAGASGTAQDVRDYEAETGERSYWTNSLFSGMPMYQIAPSYPSLDNLSFLQGLYTLKFADDLGLPSYSWLLFAMMIGFFIFMRAMDMKPFTSAMGAILWAFSSYFIILIDAGHIWKLMALSFIPPTIAGIVYSYRGKYLKGLILTTLFATLQLMSNHIQMSYYFAFLIVFMLIAFLVEAVREGQMKRFVVASLVTLLSAVLALSMNASNLYHTWQYSQETMRNGSAMSEDTATKAGGLDRDYITAWSYGKAETMTLLVPNYNGGASAYIGQDADWVKKIPKDANPQVKELVKQMPQYFGNQPFTSGPVYVGAFVVLLFLIGVFVLKGPMKWALLGGTIFSILLSWGHNFAWLTNLFIDYFPLYNKFRTVSSILVVAEFTIPTLAVMTFAKFIRSPKEMWEEHKLVISTIIAMLLLFLSCLYMSPEVFVALLSDAEELQFNELILKNQAFASVVDSLVSVRASVVSADVFRSIMVIMLGLMVCSWYVKKQANKYWTIALVLVLCFVDLWSVDKRYLNDSKFINMDKIEGQARPTTKLDEEIKKDKDEHCRVYNLSVNSFNDATTSFNHRSVGGYHAAKLSRYQDLIEHQIAKGNKQVLDMLDVKYFIHRGKDGQLRASVNDEAFGAAWFAKDIKLVKTAREAMSALDSTNLKQTAIIEQADLPKTLADYSATDDASTIELRKYTPNYLSYSVNCKEDKLMLFSDVYYPYGWVLTIDDEEVPIIRANYILRAVEVPAGQHRVVMKFAPKSLERTELLAYVAQSILFFAMLLALVLSVRDFLRARKETYQKS